MVKTIVTGNTKKDHSDRPTVVLSEIERDVRIDRMKKSILWEYIWNLA